MFYNEEDNQRFSSTKAEFLNDEKKIAESRKRVRSIMDHKMLDMADKINLSWIQCFDQLKGEMTTEQKEFYADILKITRSLTSVLERQIQNLDR